MEIRGRIIQALPLASGVSKSGNNWKKQEYILETYDQYPRKVCFNFFGDNVDKYPLQIGEDVVVSIDIESREFNGRWYTDVRAWKAEKPEAVAGAAAPQSTPFDDPFQTVQAPAAPVSQPMASAPQMEAASQPSDDLPF